MFDMSDREGVIYLNGQYVDWQDATVHFLTHTMHYGCGAFEGIRAYQTEAGAAIFRLSDHIQRLNDSLKILKMAIPSDMEQLETIICQLLSQNQMHSAYIRPMVYYGSDGMGLHVKSLSTHLGCAAWGWDKYMDPNKVKNGVHVKTASIRRLNINSNFIKAKANGHYLNSTLALREAFDAGADEALLLDHQGYVAEGSAANVFIIKDNKVYTPPLTNILAGITRATVIALFQDLDIQVFEKYFSRDEVYLADEAFFTGTALEILPISTLDNREIASGKPGPLTTTIAQSYQDIIHGRDARFSHWLTYIE